MKEQSEQQLGKFRMEKATAKGGFYLNPNKKIASLKNQLTFYQGQLDPLFLQNLSAKQNHIDLAKIVSTSTEILRNLLPTGNNAAKRLKLQMAGIEEIANIIAMDWREMENRICDLEKENGELRIIIQQWTNKFKQENSLRKTQIIQLQKSKQSMQIEYEEQLRLLRAELSKMRSEVDEYKQRLSKEEEVRKGIIESSNREMELMRRQANSQQSQYQRHISRLNNQIESGILEFEENKKNIKLIYENKMNEKLGELAESYEALLRGKDQQKLRIQQAMTDLTKQFQGKLQGKDEIIESFNLIISGMKQQYLQLQNELYLKREQLAQQMKGRRQLEEQLRKSTQTIESLQKMISNYEKIIEQKEQKIKSTINAYQENIIAIKQRGNEEVNRILQEKLKLQTKILENNQQQTKIKKYMEQLQEQYKSRLQDAKSKETQLLLTLNKNAQLYSKEKEQLKRINDQRNQSIQNLQKQHQRSLMELQNKFEQAKKQYKEEQQKKMKKIMEQNQQKIVKLNNQHKKQVQKELLKAKTEFQQKIDERQKAFNEQKTKFQQQIQLSKNLQISLNQKLLQTSKELKQNQQQIQQLKIDQQLQISKLQRQSKEKSKEMQEMISKKQSQMAEQREKFSKEKDTLLDNLVNKDKEVISMKAKHEKELTIVKQHTEKQITLLKEQTGFAEIENKIKEEMNSAQEALKTQLDQTQTKYQDQINSIKQGHEKTLQNIQSLYEQKLKETQQSFQKELVSLATFNQTKNTYFNEKHIQDQISKMLQTYTQEQKIKFIRDKIQENAFLLSQKNEQVFKMQSKLQRFQKDIQKELMERKKQLQQQLNKAINQCNNKIASKEEECRLKVEAAQKQRLLFSQKLYKEFNALKEQHRKQYEYLQKKCSELQQMFSNRPSRAQDLSKIKELINTKTKQDQEIVIIHKKMQAANEIVRYLNLQLQNYKQTYDIFKPNDTFSNHNNNKTISFNLQPKNMVQIYRTRELERVRQEKSNILLEKIDKRSNVESPQVRDFRVFGQKQEDTESLSIQPKEIMTRSRKYSLIPEKIPPSRDRFKTQKIIQKSSELVNHAESFMKLIKGVSQQQSPVKQMGDTEQLKKKTYRKRKLKRFVAGVEHYF